MESEIAEALAERLADVILEFGEANQDMRARDVLAALEWTYACVERHTDDRPAHKMH